VYTAAMNASTRESPRALPGGPAAGLALLVLVAALAASCATKRAPIEPIAPASPPQGAPTASLRAASPIFRDQFSLTLPFVLLVRNPRSEAIAIEAPVCELSIAGRDGAKLGSSEGRVLASGGEAEFAFAFPVDARELGDAFSGELGPSAAPWRAWARVASRAADGTPIELRAEAEGAFPIIREPRFTLRSIRIERDLLVTTNMRLGLEIENLNEFPLALSSIEYDFYGEGKIWASGADDDATPIPALGRAERELAFEMNFAEMDRRLFDLVAKLQVVRYRIAGRASIATGLDFLPTFMASFDREGSCSVER
jgi:hypothetical protein